MVLAVALVAVAFLILAPESSWSRAVALALAGGMLLVVVLTSRGDRQLRNRASGALIAATLALALALGLELIPTVAGSLAAALLVLATLVQLVRGLVRLLQARGVTVEAVAGALAIYLLLGIVFAFAITALAVLGDGPYFAQGTDGTDSQRVYFSFTTMTTTGFGDLTPATSGGRTLAVIEMLTGQIYLVTVISLLVGNLGRRRGEEPAAGAAP